MDNNQSMKMSGIESAAQMVVGFCLSWAVWIWVAGPLFGWDVSAQSGLKVVLLFTAVSFMRQFALRRLFNFIGRQR